MVERKAGVIVGEFDCDQNFMHYWWDRLESLDVPTPKTWTFPIRGESVNFPKIVDVMEENGLNHAFIRSDNFSDKIHPEHGSHIANPTVKEVRRTYETLYHHHRNTMDVPMGEYVAVREWLDLDYCPDLGCAHDTEVRFFVEDGEILYFFPDLETENKGMECLYSYVRKVFDEGVSPPVSYAEEVAREFDELSWHVDFVLTARGEWYCVDMGLNAAYWHEEEDGWWNMSEHHPDQEDTPADLANQRLKVKSR